MVISDTYCILLTLFLDLCMQQSFPRSCAFKLTTNYLAEHFFIFARIYVFQCAYVLFVFKWLSNYASV